MDRYGDAIEADLHRHYSVDLLDVYRYDDAGFPRLSPRKVLNLVDRLPRDSLYGEAIAQDEELVDVEPAPGQQQGAARPAVSEWSFPVEITVLTYDRLGEVLAQLRAIATRKAQKAPKPHPRPLTAGDKAEAIRRRRIHDDIISKVLPGGDA